MNLIYKKADINDIDDLISLKIKQNDFYNNIDNITTEDENIIKENISRILLQELNKTIYFFVAKDKDNNRTVACSGVVIHQMVPSSSFINGKKGYITSVYTDEDYRRNGIQNILMKMIMDFLKEIECKKVELDATELPAIKLYEKFGFKKDNQKYILENQ